MCLSSLWETRFRPGSVMHYPQVWGIAPKVDLAMGMSKCKIFHISLNRTYN